MKPISKKELFKLNVDSVDNYFDHFIKKKSEIDFNKPLLEVVDLKKKYYKKKVPAINKLNFCVYPGEFHAFVGANGAGKTTTIKSIIGSYRNFEGTIYISGINNRNLESRQKLGYIPETAIFPPRITAFEYLVYMAKLNKTKTSAAKLFAECVLKKFSMWNLRNHCPNNFSSGQKKKILLAQALSNNPDLLVMDEPTANLDPRARIDFFNILELLRKQNKAILISSHILTELDLYSNAVTILDNGRIAYTEKREKYADSNLYRIVIKNELNQKSILNYKINDHNEIIYKFTNQNELNTLIEYLIKENKLIKFERYYLTIEDLYKKYVIYGSVDTKQESNTNN
ncbi:MAG: ABC transporter ATP-binding protein [Malacoplasma sp.]|nr:ABC transporter ATP-binding protein [Malacoplasma sp.]